MAEFTPFDYVIEKALISSDRLTEDYSISDTIAEINIYENLDKSYLTGNLTFVDTYDLLNTIDFLGAELLDLEISIPSDDTKSFNRTFNIHSIDKAIKTNDNTEVITLNLIEDSYFKSELTTISKGYEGRPEDIIKNLFNDGEIERDLDYDGNIFQENFRVIIPYLTPMESAFFVKDRLTDVNGMPYYLFSSFGDKDRIKLTSLSDMLKSDPITTESDPFIFTQSAASKSRALSLEGKSRLISSYSMNRTEELIKFVKAGAIGADYEFINLINMNRTERYKFDIDSEYKKLVGAGVIKHAAPIYDNRFMGGLHNKQAIKTTQIFSDQIFVDPGVNNIYDAVDHKNKASSTSMRKFITKSPMDFEVPGLLMISNDTESRCVGRTVSVKFLKNIQPYGQIDTDDVTDNKKSGQYLVYSARHTFRSSSYSVGITGVKLHNLEGTSSTTPTIGPQ